MYLVSFGVTQALGLWTKCFIGGTLVLTSIGLVKIEDIKVGDEVYSYNEETNKKELKKVKRIFSNKTNEWLHLTINAKEKEEEIICTKNHRRYINNKGWIEAKDIIENDEVLLYNNIIGTVIKKELQILDHYETTYNFEVEDNHNYYVSDSCVLVHNECIKKLDVDDFMRKNKLNREEFHALKKDIIKQSKIPNIYGKNPDIYYNKKTLQIYLQSTTNKKLPRFETSLTLEGWRL